MLPPRSILFCVVAFFYVGCCQLYIFLFIANVSENDAAQWWESVALGLAQDLKSRVFGGTAWHVSEFLLPLGFARGCFTVLHAFTYCQSVSKTKGLASNRFLLLPCLCQS